MTGGSGGAVGKAADWAAGPAAPDGVAAAEESRLSGASFMGRHSRLSSTGGAACGARLVLRRGSRIGLGPGMDRDGMEQQDRGLYSRIWSRGGVGTRMGPAHLLDVGGVLKGGHRSESAEGYLNKYLNSAQPADGPDCKKNRELRRFDVDRASAAAIPNRDCFVQLAKSKTSTAEASESGGIGRRAGFRIL